MVYYLTLSKRHLQTSTCRTQDFNYIEVNHTTINKAPGHLPPSEPIKPESVTATIKDFANLQSISADSIQNVPYKPYFKLELISSGGIGIGSSTGFGTMVGGGLFMKFSERTRKQ